eukprot:240234-Prymnesium_polylepis.1
MRCAAADILPDEIFALRDHRLRDTARTARGRRRATRYGRCSHQHFHDGTVCLHPFSSCRHQELIQRDASGNDHVRPERVNVILARRYAGRHASITMPIVARRDPAAGSRKPHKLELAGTLLDRDVCEALSIMHLRCLFCVSVKVLQPHAGWQGTRARLRAVVRKVGDRKAPLPRLTTGPSGLRGFATVGRGPRIR